MGWTDGGCFGSKYYRTPNLDTLAASGMRFTQAYAASAARQRCLAETRVDGIMDVIAHTGGAHRQRGSTQQPSGFLGGVPAKQGELRFLPVTDASIPPFYPEQGLAGLDGRDGAAPATRQDFVGLGPEQTILGCRPTPLLAAPAGYLPRSALLPDGVQRPAS